MTDLRTKYSIDDELVTRLRVAEGDVVLELGCGRCFTLAAAARQAPDVTLVGLDLDQEALDDGREVLEEAGGRNLRVVADLSDPLPLVSGSVTHLICHNVLGDLPDPAAAIAEASRVMRPGARSVWSHTDFDAVVISGGDPELTRRVVAAYARTPDPPMVQVDGQIGRKLPGLIAASPLHRESVESRVLLGTELNGPPEVRVRSMFALVREASLAGEVDITIEELEAWMESLRIADREGRFLYTHITYIVVATRP